jgi:hypothetical protein
MPVFFLIAALAGTLTAGSTAGKIHYQRSHGPVASQQAPAAGFQASAFDSASDCLTAASLQHAVLSSCEGKM